MAWYGQNTSKLDIENPSLIIAFSNLLKRFGHTVEPDALLVELTQDDPIVDWWTLAEYIEGYEVLEMIEQPSWPTTNNAIIRFQRLDYATAGVVDHYCLVADPKVMSIIDSLDGSIKPAHIYGSPKAWASYAPDTTKDPEALTEANRTKTGSTYTVLRGGESVWEIARKLKMPAADLIEHNDIKEPNMIPAGTKLHLLYALPSSGERVVTYKIFDQPMDMHVNKEDGATKWLFGNVKKWGDLSPSGPTYPRNTNISILGIAEVPIGDETAAYYLDHLSLGDYATTGRVQYTAGFNHSHLTEGFVKVQAPVIAPEVQTKLDIAEEKLAEMAAETPAPEEPEPVMDFTKEAEPEPTPIGVNYNEWKTTYKPFDEPILYSTNADMIVVDIDEKRPNRPLEGNKTIYIAGTFVRNGIEYGRPSGAVRQFTWYGIPMTSITSEDELYNYEVPLTDRVAMKNGRLTLNERYITVPLARAISQYTHLKAYVKNKTKRSN